MKNVSGRVLTMILLTSGTLGCSHDKEETVAQGADGASSESGDLSGARERTKANKTIEPHLGPAQMVLRGGTAPAVALMLVAETLTVREGKVDIPVKPSDAVLHNNECGSKACLKVFAAAKDAWVPNGEHCTVTFIDDRTIITGSHCITSGDWPHSYILIDHVRPDIDIDIDSRIARVDAKRVARLQCLRSCEDSYDGDWAIIDIKPLEGDEIDEHATLKLANPVKEKPVVVQSHMLGLPLLQFKTQRTSDHRRLRFTNHGTGSGAPLLQDGKIVGIVSGSSPKLDYSCSSDDGDNCIGQVVTWYDRIEDQRSKMSECKNRQVEICS